MSESEQREIEEAAKAHALQNEAARYFELKPALRNIALQCSNEGYIAGATAMAEKKNVEIEEWRTVANTEILLNKSYKKEIDEIKMEAAKVFIDYGNSLEKYKAQLEAAQEELKKAMFDIQVGNDLIKSLQAELSRVKEVVEKMGACLEKYPFNENKPLSEMESKVQEALTEFANLMNKEK